MKLGILRNNFERVNLSMKAYADSLLKALKGTEEIKEFKPHSGILGVFADEKSVLGRFKNYYERFWLYPRAIKGGSCDIYHIVDHTFSYLLKYLHGKNTVVTCHDLIFLRLMRGEYKNHKAPRFASYLFKDSIEHINKASHIISVSENTKNDLIELLGIPQEKITTVHHGINGIFFSHTAPAKTVKERFTILHVGGNWFYKNIEAILEAIALLKPDFRRRVMFLRAGANFTKGQLRLIAKRGISGNVTAIPTVALMDLPSVYADCDLFCFPSLYEGFGWPPLEAMASGVPVISSNRASLPEICGDAALYVDPQDYQGIANSIEEILNNEKLRNNLIEKGRRRAVSFTWEASAEKTLRVYREVLNT